ncbi:MAG: DUF1440 domain-containing protein [Chloroflexi bacterium]|nr:DUF1440 domain-containing protein [Chloroflexota bacterium]
MSTTTYSGSDLQVQTHFAPPAVLRAACGAAAGLIAGLLYWVLLTSQNVSPLMSASDIPGDLLVHLVLSTLTGIIFALTFGKLVITPGAGIMWGVVFGLMWWFVGPLTLFPIFNGQPVTWTIGAAQDAFPLLTGLAVSFGAAMGLIYLTLAALFAGKLNPQNLRNIGLTFVGLAVSGALAGLLGGLVFGGWMSRVQFFPLVAQILQTDSADAGYALHILISVIIGATFGVLFRADIRGLGTSIAWGFAYGFIWWILGALTLMPVFLGVGVQWSLGVAQENFGSLVGHIVYGLILGLSYALIVRTYQILFVDSDPLNREPEGPGTRNVRALGLGIIASVTGGLAFTLVMVATNTLPSVAGVVGGNAALVGFVVHMSISAIIGATYGLLFQRNVHTYGSALSWGIVFGLVWWFIGPLTLMPLILSGSLAWNLDAATANFPSLIGHMLYGGFLAVTFRWLTERFDPVRQRALPLNKRYQPPQPQQQTPTAAALWTLTLLLSLVLVLLLGTGA